MDQALISKYFLGEATEEEILKIYQWIEASPQNKELFILYKQKWSLNAIAKEDVDAAWNHLKRNEIQLKSNKKSFGILKYAALFALIIGTSLYFSQILHPFSDLKQENKEAITLILPNGKTEVFSDNEKRVIKNANGHIMGTQIGGQLTYTKEAPTSRETVFNEIKVPDGKRFNLLLSDGTHIALNAGSSLKYPEKFALGKKRQVYLEGEAFFDVQKDSAHPFVVHIKDKRINVLGTKFNVSNYPEDNENNTVLVEGSIALYKADDNNGKQVLLHPGYKAAWTDASPDKVSVEEVDTEIYTSWKEGRLIFKNAPFNEIRRKLQRHYNVKIENKDLILEDKKYTGTFDLENIQEILAILNESYPIRYIEENNTIIIY